MDATDYGNIFTHTFIFEHDDGTDTFVQRARSMMLDEVLKDFAAFLHDERVGFYNDITFIIHGGLEGDTVIKCKAPSVE